MRNHAGLYGATESQLRGDLHDGVLTGRMRWDGTSCGGTGQASVDIPFRITRNTRTKEIQTKRMKKDYRVVYNQHVIIDDYKTLPYMDINLTH